MARESLDFRRALRHIPGEGDRDAADELHDLYRSGRISIRYTANGGLEYLGTDAVRAAEARRNRRH